VDPVFTSCPSASIPLGCNPAAITNTKAITDAGAVTDNCHVASVSAVAVGAPVNTPGTCSWTQSWTVTALDDCGNDAICTVTYTWTVDLVDPVFTSCPSASIPLGCNPAAITNTKAITDAGAVTDNCHVASVSAVAVGAPSNTPGTCSWTQSWTVTALDDCGNDAICTVTYTWTVDLVDPVFTSCPSLLFRWDATPLPFTIRRLSPMPVQSQIIAMSLRFLQ
jgi:hypothetical protein